jgi:hypothetical protein
MILRELETLTIRTALGIQFWDSVLARAVTDGLRVTAQRMTDPPPPPPALQTPRQRVGRARTAVQTRGGNYAFFGLHPDELTDTEPMPEYYVVIDVEDPLGRFLPASFEVVIPVNKLFRGRGSWLPRPLMLPAPSPNQDLGVFLWSAPTRQVSPGLTVVNADVAIGDADQPPPTPYALVRLMNGASTVHAIGMTDENGKLTLPMAYPSIPHVTPQPPLRTHTFNLTVEVLYDSSAQVKLPGSRVPNLALLLGQSQKQIGIERNPTTRATTFAAELPLQFGFEEPVVLRTRSTDPTRRDPYLRIQA